ncbi:hypothetical protein ACIBSW_03650 [Actinoplanes sp. NPDC049668]|uniref:hypothetical protein n=1 Tax=unclassified Actinoplanes TaxID=2626549 RepID=UPI0033B20CF4
MIFGFIGLLCWALVVAHLFSRRVYSVVVDAARGRPARAAAVAAGLQLGGLLAFGLFCIAGIALARHFDAARYAAYAVVPGCLLYTPLLVLALPGGPGGYRHVRGDLGEAGADRRVARAAAWAAGPFAVLGLAAVLSGLVATFGP